MVDGGVEYIRRTDSELRKLQEEVTGLTELASRLRSDITLEAKLRGGDISTLQHKLNSDLAAEISALRKESHERANALEVELRTTTRELRQELAALIPRVGSLESAVAQRKDENDLTNQRCEATEKDVTTLRRELSANVESLSSRLVEAKAQASTDRDAAACASRTVAAKAAQDCQRIEETVVTVSHSMEGAKKALLADICNVAAKLDGVEAFAYTRAKAVDVQALEFRVNDTIEKTLKHLNEELGRKESCANVKSLSDRVTTVWLDVTANDAKGQAADEALGKQLSTLEQAVAKAGRQADADRERANECWVTLERECGTKAAKADFDAALVRLSVAESTLNPLAEAMPTKAGNHDMKQLSSRVLALEQVYPTKADASELPKIHLMVADVSAKHDGLTTRAQDQHNRLERLDDVQREQQGRVEGVDSRTKDLQAALGTKADSEAVYDKESTGLMLNQYYRKEEVDAMMTRVWWRVGDSCKTSRLPSPWSPGAC